MARARGLEVQHVLFLGPEEPKPQDFQVSSFSI